MIRRLLEKRQEEGEPVNTYNSASFSRWTEPEENIGSNDGSYMKEVVSKSKFFRYCSGYTPSKLEGTWLEPNHIEAQREDKESEIIDDDTSEDIPQNIPTDAKPSESSAVTEKKKRCTGVMFSRSDPYDKMAYQRSYMGDDYTPGKSLNTNEMSKIRSQYPRSSGLKFDDVKDVPDRYRQYVKVDPRYVSSSSSKFSIALDLKSDGSETNTEEEEENVTSTGDSFLIEDMVARESASVERQKIVSQVEKDTQHVFTNDGIDPSISKKLNHNGRGTLFGPHMMDESAHRLNYDTRYQDEIKFNNPDHGNMSGMTPKPPKFMSKVLSMYSNRNPTVSGSFNRETPLDNPTDNSANETQIHRAPPSQPLVDTRNLPSKLDIDGHKSSLKGMIPPEGRLQRSQHGNTQLYRDGEFGLEPPSGYDRTVPPTERSIRNGLMPTQETPFTRGITRNTPLKDTTSIGALDTQALRHVGVYNQPIDISDDKYHSGTLRREVTTDQIYKNARYTNSVSDKSVLEDRVVAGDITSTDTYQSRDQLLLKGVGDNVSTHLRSSNDDDRFARIMALRDAAVFERSSIKRSSANENNYRQDLYGKTFGRQEEKDISEWGNATREDFEYRDRVVSLPDDSDQLKDGDRDSSSLFPNSNSQRFGSQINSPKDSGDVRNVDVSTTNDSLANMHRDVHPEDETEERRHTEFMNTDRDRRQYRSIDENVDINPANQSIGIKGYTPSTLKQRREDDLLSYLSKRKQHEGNDQETSELSKNTRLKDMLFQNGMTSKNDTSTVNTLRNFEKVESGGVPLNRLKPNHVGDIRPPSFEISTDGGVPLNGLKLTTQKVRGPSFDMSKGETQGQLRDATQPLLGHTNFIKDDWRHQQDDPNSSRKKNRTKKSRGLLVNGPEPNNQKQNTESILDVTNHTAPDTPIRKHIDGRYVDIRGTTKDVNKSEFNTNSARAESGSKLAKQNTDVFPTNDAIFKQKHNIRNDRHISKGTGKNPSDDTHTVRDDIYETNHGFDSNGKTRQTLDTGNRSLERNTSSNQLTKKQDVMVDHTSVNKSYQKMGVSLKNRNTDSTESSTRETPISPKITFDPSLSSDERSNRHGLSSEIGGDVNFSNMRGGLNISNMGLTTNERDLSSENNIDSVVHIESKHKQQLETSLDAHRRGISTDESKIDSSTRALLGVEDRMRNHPSLGVSFVRYEDEIDRKRIDKGPVVDKDIERHNMGVSLGRKMNGVLFPEKPSRGGDQSEKINHTPFGTSISRLGIKNKTGGSNGVSYETKRNTDTRFENEKDILISHFKPFIDSKLDKRDL